MAARRGAEVRRDGEAPSASLISDAACGRPEATPVRAILVLVILVASFAVVAPPASAVCHVATIPELGQMNYTTVCVQHVYGNGDPYFPEEHDYFAHVSHADRVAEAGFTDWAGLNAGTDSWQYIDPDTGEAYHQGTRTNIGGGYFVQQDVFGTGAHANVDQRDQSASRDDGGLCSAVVGRSTCVGAGGWFTVRDVASVGVGAYYTQTGTSTDCREHAELYVDAVLLFVPLITPDQPCTREIPVIQPFWHAVPPL